MSVSRSTNRNSEASAYSNCDFGNSRPLNPKWDIRAKVSESRTAPKKHPHVDFRQGGVHNAPMWIAILLFTLQNSVLLYPRLTFSPEGKARKETNFEMR